MLFLLEPPPAETTGYMIAGYVVIFTVMAIYLASLFIRSRNLKLDLDTLSDADLKDP